MKFLLIEDERLLADALTELLTSRGFQVEVVYDGEAGTEYALLRAIYAAAMKDGKKTGILLQSEDYDDAAKKRFSVNILSMSRQMRGLVEGLLDLARIDARKTREQMEEVNLSELAEACVLGFEPVYFEAGRELCSTVEPGIRIAGSESHLQQVIDILLVSTVRRERRWC